MNSVGRTLASLLVDSPWENEYCESFTARFRNVLLNGGIFYTLREAQIIIEHMEETLQYLETTHCFGLPANSPGDHRPDGPKASHGLTFRLDQIPEAGQIRTLTIQMP